MVRFVAALELNAHHKTTKLSVYVRRAHKAIHLSRVSPVDANTMKIVPIMRLVIA